MMVLLVTGSFPPDRCGVGAYSAKLYEQLESNSEVDVRILTSKTSQSSSPDDVHVFRVMDRWTLREAPKFLRVLRDLKPDLVHLQYPTQGYADASLPWFIPLITRLTGVKVVQTWHEPYSRRRAFKLLLKACVGGGLIVVRPDYLKKLHRMLHWAVWGKHYRYIRSASKIPVCTLAHNELTELRTRYLQGQQRLVVFFGFIYPHKCVDLLFDISNPETDRIIIAGECKSDSYRSALQSRAKLPPWSGQVAFRGYMNDQNVSALLAVADAVVLPFLHGGVDWNTSIHAATQA